QFPPPLFPRFGREQRPHQTAIFDYKKGRNFAACRSVEMKLQTELSDFKTLNHGSSHRPTEPKVKRARTANHRIPKWAHLLFILLAGFVTYRIFQHRTIELKAAPAAPRPARVAKVITRDRP